MQVDLLNEAGGVGGKPIEYEIKELPGDPSAAQRAAQELLDDGVNAIIGPPFAYNGVPADRHRRRQGPGDLQRIDRPRRSPTPAAAPS